MKSLLSVLFLAGFLSHAAASPFPDPDYNDGDKKHCLSQAEADDVTQRWLGIFSGHIELLNSTLASDVVVYDSLVNNGNLAPIATNKADYYAFVNKFTYPQDGVIKNAKYTLEGGGLMFHTCDKIAMRYIGHAESAGKLYVVVISTCSVFYFFYNFET